eukprot:Awhi_evm1s12953
MKGDLALFGTIENLIRVYGSQCGAHIHKEKLRIYLKEDLALFGSMDNLMRVYGSNGGSEFMDLSAGQISIKKNSGYI